MLEQYICANTLENILMYEVLQSNAFSTIRRSVLHIKTFEVLKKLPSSYQWSILMRLRLKVK